MQIIEFEELNEIATYQQQQPICLTIGSFDAIHLGHQELIANTVQVAKSNHLIPALLTFRHNPRKITNSKKSGETVLTFENRLKLIRDQGIKLCFIINFNKEFCNLSHHDFFHDTLKKNFHVNQLICGFDFHFGKDRLGNTQYLKNLPDAKQWLHIVEPLKINDTIVSTSAIREFIKTGKITHANQFLGRNYFIEGPIITGDGRGKVIGIPTANLAPQTDVLPLLGVYITETFFQDRKFQSITNIGLKPTFHQQQKEISIETHIFDFKEEIHHKFIKIDFLDFIRPEIKFENSDQLVQQIKKDIQQAHLFFKSKA